MQSCEILCFDQMYIHHMRKIRHKSYLWLILFFKFYDWLTDLRKQRLLFIIKYKLWQQENNSFQSIEFWHYYVFFPFTCFPCSSYCHVQVNVPNLPICASFFSSILNLIWLVHACTCNLIGSWMHMSWHVEIC